MTLTRDHKGTGIFTVRCDGCGRVERGAQDMLAAELCSALSAEGWHLTRKEDHCKGCARTADAKAKKK